MSARWQRREFLRLALVQLGAWPLASAFGCADTVYQTASSDASASAVETDPSDAQAASFQLSPVLRDQLALLDRSALLEAFVEDGDLALAAELGAQYLHAVAPGGDYESVRGALRSAISLLERPTYDADAIEELAAAIRAEFAARDVVDFEGWTLAPTELALCALLWIAQGAGEALDAGFDAASAPDAS